jgi:hypothetical protein
MRQITSGAHHDSEQLLCVIEIEDRGTPLVELALERHQSTNPKGYAQKISDLLCCLRNSHDESRGKLIKGNTVSLVKGEPIHVNFHDTQNVQMSAVMIGDEVLLTASSNGRSCL